MGRVMDDDEFPGGMSHNEWEAAMDGVLDRLK